MHSSKAIFILSKLLITWASQQILEHHNIVQYHSLYFTFHEINIIYCNKMGPTTDIFKRRVYVLKLPYRSETDSSIKR